MKSTALQQAATKQDIKDLHDQFAGQFSLVASQFSAVNNRLDAHERLLNELVRVTDDISTNLAVMMQYISDRFDKVERRLDTLERVVGRVLLRLDDHEIVSKILRST